MKAFLELPCNRRFDIVGYITIYNRQYWEFNILPYFEIRKDGKYFEIDIRFLIFGMDVFSYSKDKPYLERRVK